MATRATRRQVAEAVLALMEQQKPQSEIAKQVASYLVRERRTKELNSLVRDMQKIRHRRGGPLEVTTTSASPLTDTIKDTIARTLSATNVVFNEVRDEAVVGGVRVETFDRQLDLTIHGRLKSLQTKSGKDI